MEQPAGAVRFTVLGPVQAWRGEAELPLGTPQQRAVLAMLALRPAQAVSVDQLVAGLWGEDPPPRALGTLRTYVSRLRTVFGGEDLLVSVGNCYALRCGAEDVDVGVFERLVAEAGQAKADGDLGEAGRLLTAALRQWRGEPLAGVPGPYGVAQRTRLAERRLTTLETRVEVELARGEHAGVVAELTALTSEHPLRERLRELLMLALYRGGRQAEALGVFTDTRRTLTKELGIEPGERLCALHQGILAADPDLAGPAPAAGPSAEPVVPKPAQLPADVADFTGRATRVGELAAVLRAGADGAVPITAISGIGGIGKTALTVHIAHSVRGDYPDGQLYVDLEGTSSRPRDPAAVLAGFLRALGVADSAVPEEASERAALFRSCLAGRRVLLVLDNARDAEQVGPLLPGAGGSAVLITSRTTMAGLPAVFVPLEALERAEAAALFGAIVGQRRAGEEPDAVLDVLTACGFLPLAVRIAASRLACRPDWTIASFARRLRDEYRRLDQLRVGDLAVEATFELSYRQLGAEHAEAFRLLSVPDTAFLPLATAAAALDLAEQRAEDILESLVDTGLLDSPRPGQYHYHDLLRLYARRKAEDVDPAGERGAVVGRVLDFTLATTRNVFRLLEPGDSQPGYVVPTYAAGLSFAGHDEARDWLDVMRDSTMRIVGQTTEDPAGELRQAADLMLLLALLMDRVSPSGDVGLAARAVAAAARRRGDRGSEIRSRHALAVFLHHAWRMPEAEAELTTGLELSTASGDTQCVAQSLLGLGICAVERRGYADALALLDKARPLYRSLGDNAAVAFTVATSACAHLGVGDGDRALAAAAEALAVSRDIGDSIATPNALHQIGIVLGELGRTEEAGAHLREAIAMYKRARLRTQTARVLLCLAEVHRKAGEFGQALDVAEEALAIGRQSHHAYVIAGALAALGSALDGLNQPGRALTCRQQALGLFESCGAPETEHVRGLLSGAVPSP
ncbi:BTAD domain-containing putative transcriptional regulator [Amycolatopsis sp. NPDC058986]|uniref:AfsR/SARP family transcriptional regulator n=1 Tax=unclassified Amycolatopsis TaxID=2618356 RepID=UPI00366E0AAE